MSMTIEIIPARVHRHADGRTASIYGAVPWYSGAERAEWRVETVGYTWRVTDTFGAVTIGLGRRPANTYAEALAAAERWAAVAPEYRTVVAE